MSDETQKMMGFILEQLADLTAKQQQTDSNLNRLANASLNRIERIEDVVGALAEAQVRTEGHVSALVQAQLRTEEKMATLAEKGAETPSQRRAEWRVVKVSEGCRALR
jgi:K+/H+ antiporter YhaU regulatory subunit KhtT